jgi:RNA polymerase sigma factor (sigma-70 family)
MFPRLIVVRFFLGGLSSSNGGSQGREDKHMTKNEKNETVNHATLNYPHPYFVPIEDKDTDTIKFYQNNNVPVRHIALPGRMKHYYAIFNADTEEMADLMNRTFSNWARKEARDKAAQSEHETSYDALQEEGYDPADDHSNPEEMLAYKIVLDALKKALDELSKEKLRACRMVADKEPQRKVAEELGISRWTLRERKDSAMDELQKKMKPYR